MLYKNKIIVFSSNIFRAACRPKFIFLALGYTWYYQKSLLPACLVLGKLTVKTHSFSGIIELSFKAISKHGFTDARCPTNTGYATCQRIQSHHVPAKHSQPWFWTLCIDWYVNICICVWILSNRKRK